MSAQVSINLLIHSQTLKMGIKHIPQFPYPLNFSMKLNVWWSPPNPDLPILGEPAMPVLRETVMT